MQVKLQSELQCKKETKCRDPKPKQGKVHYKGQKPFTHQGQISNQQSQDKINVLVIL